MDWRNPDPGLIADLVLASDIAYEKKSFSDLTRTFKALLKPGGIMLIAEPNRAFAQSFFVNLSKEGFDVRSEKSELTFRGQQYSIYIHELKLVKNSD